MAGKVQPLKPRRKYTLQGEIKVALARFKHQYDGAWTFVPDKRVMRQIIQLYTDKFLYVKGTKYDSINLERKELLLYISTLPYPDSKEQPTGVKLRNTPVFYQDLPIPIQMNGNISKMPKVNQKDFTKKCIESIAYHKTVEGHHPDGIGWNGGVDATIECVFDVYNSLLRTFSVKSAYSKLLIILESDKYTNLVPEGILFACLHLIVRGVALSHRLLASGEWRREGVSRELLFKASYDFLNRIPPPTLVANYRSETLLHIECMRSEMKRLRISNDARKFHDYSKLQPYMVYYYSWYWGVYNRMSSNDQNLFDMGVTYDSQDFPTMFTVGKSMGEGFLNGVVNAPEMSEVLRFSREFPQETQKVLEETIQNSVNMFDNKLECREESLMNRLTEKASEVLQKVRDEGSKLADEKLDRAVAESQSIVSQLKATLTPLLDLADTLQGMISGVIESVSKFFLSVPGFAGLNISMNSILDALKYYIVYINTESTPLKMIVVFLIMNSLGITKIVFSEIIKYWQWLQGTTILDGEEVTAEPTSLLEWAIASPLNVVKIFGGVIAYLVKGSALLPKEFLSLSKKLADTLRNFHFIGAGITGILKIYDYFMKFWSTVTDWIAEKWYGKTPERVALSRRVTKFLVKLKYFSSEAGMNAIKLNEPVRAQAERLLPEWTELLVETRKEKENRNLYIDLDRQSRAVKDVSDFVTRFRSVSNFQPTMFHIQLVGPPGIGKSTMVKKLVADLSCSFWPDEPTPSFYSLNMNLDYYDGYAGQKIMIADDVYKMNEPKHLTATIGLITNTPVILPMANLSDKGMQLTSELMLSTTNTPYPIGKDILCMEAVHRRRHLLVSVHCDPRVVDKASGQFSMALFEKCYPNQKPSDLPHMKFGLLKPVATEFAGAAPPVHVTEDEFELYARYAKDLEDANFKISTTGEKLSPRFYFTAENAPPGITIPATDWSYQQLLHNCAVRFHAFRKQEGSYDRRAKYSHVENCLAEIEALIEQRKHTSGPEFPITKLVSQHVFDASVPYPSEDPVFSAGLDTDQHVNELNEIDFDALVDSILDENMPTGSDDERIRTAEILRRRNRRVEPSALKHRMRVVNKNGNFYIPLEDHTTIWDHRPELIGDYPALVSTIGKKLESAYWNSISPAESFVAVITDAVSKYKWPEILVTNEFLRHHFAAEMIYPEGFGAKSGTPTGFPISFFHDLEYIDGQYYLNVNKFHHPNLITDIDVTKDGTRYTVPFDVAFIMNEFVQFRMFIAEFNQLSLEQQQILIQDAKWRYQYTGSYTYDKIRRDCTSIFGKFKNSALYYVTSPAVWLLEKHPFLVAMISLMLTYVVVLWTCHKIGSLFNPYPTSKVLHRGPPSNIVYRGNKPTSLQSSRDLVETMLERNVRKITLQDQRTAVTAQALQTEQYLIFNSHLLRWVNMEELEVVIHGKQGPKIFPIDKKSVYMDPSSDLAIIYSRLIPSTRKVSHHFIPQKIYDRAEFTGNLSFISWTRDYPLVEHFPYIGKTQDLVLTADGNVSRLSNAIMVSASTTCGKSGTTVFSEHQGRTYVLGIQAWQVDSLYSPKIAIQVVTSEKFDELVLKVEEQVNESIPHRIVEPEYTDCIPTGAFVEVPRENLICEDEHVVGDVGRNQIKPSFISNYLTRAGIQTERVPAAMSDRDKRLYHGATIHPMAHSLGKYYRSTITPIPKNLINRASKMLVKYIRSRLDTKDFSPLSIEETIVGTREDGSNPMNLKSSPGIPFIFSHREEKGKKDYMRVDELGNVSHIDEEFIDGYFRFEDSLAKGEVPYTRAYDFPKDELRPIKKALGSADSPPKTRSVTCMNVYYVLAWRRYTLRFWAAMHRAADGTFPFCPGINPEGPEWNNLYHTLNKHPNAVDFDVSNWDGFYFSQLFYKVLDIVKELIGVKSKTSVDYILNSIFYDVMNCFIQYLNIVYQKDRGLVSGFPGTAEVNTLGHWLLALCIYLKIVACTCYDNFEAFNHNVSLAIYGDDILYTISNELIGLVNGITLREGYESIGYPVTSASKISEVEYSKKLMDCKFLKSTWRELVPGYYIRKMDMEIANDLVHWVRAKEHPHLQFFENYIDALHVAFGNGEQVFNQFQMTVNDILRELNEDIIFYDYKDFEFDYFSRYLPLYISH